MFATYPNPKVEAAAKPEGKVATKPPDKHEETTERKQESKSERSPEDPEEGLLKVKVAIYADEPGVHCIEVSHIFGDKVHYQSLFKNIAKFVNEDL